MKPGRMLFLASTLSVLAGTAIAQTSSSDERLGDRRAFRHGEPAVTADARLVQAARLEAESSGVPMEWNTTNVATDGEASAPILPCTPNTVGGSGTPLGDRGQGLGPAVDDDAYFGGDRKIRPTNLGDAEIAHCMASASDGHLFVAWQDDALGDEYIQVYHSTTQGASWTAFGYVIQSGARLLSPSIAVGEGSSGDSLLLTYIVDDGINTPVPEVAVAPISTGVFSTHTVPVWAWEAYGHPVVRTDSMKYSTWYAYLTCEGVFDSSIQNVNVCTWRSLDGGATWVDSQVPYGNFDSDSWLDPDIAFGTSSNRVFLATYHRQLLELSTNTSDDFALTWNSPVIAATLSLLPGNAVDPQIAPAINNANVMLACTRDGGVDEDDIGYTYSQDGGATWSTFWDLPGRRPYDDFAVSMTANEGGGSWHLAYTSAQDGSVHYSDRPQDLSDLWTQENRVFDDRGRAGTYGDFAKKGITSDWAADRPYVAWADARDEAIGDYDGYVDFLGNEGLTISRHLIGPNEEADIELTLFAGVANANRGYAIFGSYTGTEPGLPLPGGYVTLPINWDLLTLYTLTWGPPVFYRFRGVLDDEGKATARMYIPPGLDLPALIEFDFAFALTKPWNYGSNAVALHVSF